jgi:Trypsin
MQRLLAFLTVFAIFGGISVSNANSLQEDHIVIGDERTVGITGPYGGVGCGGALIAPRIVYTAAHCVARRLKADISADTTGSPIVSGMIPGYIADLYVYMPGVDVDASPDKKVKVIAQFASPKYEDSSHACGTDSNKKCHPSLYDFAILILEKEISTTSYRIATSQEISEFVQSKSLVFGIGYGPKKYYPANSGVMGIQSQPGIYYANLRNNSEYIWQGTELNTPYIPYMTIQTKCAIACAGIISGSPLWIEKNGESIYLGAVSATNGPTAQVNPNDSIWKDPFWSINGGGEYYTAQAFPDVIEDAKKFLAEQTIIEAKVAAELKAKQEADAKAAAELKAKQEADAKAAAELKAKQEADAKAAAELKAKQDLEARIAAELKAKQEAEAKTALLKKTTITCVKGKLVKKVTGVKPVCPKGYKKK